MKSSLFISSIFVSLAFFSMTDVAAQVSCNTYQSGVAVPSGYGAAYDVFSPTNLLIKSNCPTGNTLTITKGTGDQNQYVYEKGYAWNGTSWQQFTLSGTAKEGVWFKGQATITVPKPSADMYFVGYVCSYVNSTWQCGCSDTACATSAWQLQKYTAGGTPGGGGSDDTFSCLSSGSIVRLNENFGYSEYENRQAADGTKIDARTSKWLHQQTPAALNLYPVLLGAAANGCFAGGVFEGTTPALSDWRDRYGHTGSAGGNSAAIRIEAAQNFTMAGIRMHNMWDSFRASDQSENFIVRDNWVTDGHDDCVENDTLLSGKVLDNLFDGCFVFQSARPGSQANVNSSTGAGKVVRVESNLVYMKAIRRDNSWQEGHLFKINGSAGGPKFEIHDNLFMHEGQKPPETADADVPEITSVTPGKVNSCSGNIMIWRGEGAFPGSWPNSQFPGCMQVVTGADGLGLWQAAKQNWIDCHPSIERLPGDPTPNPSACKPTAWGGGGTQDPR